MGPFQRCPEYSIAHRTQLIIVLASPCILWLLIISPALPLALGPIGFPSLFNCLKFPRCPPSLSPSPSLLSHTNSHSPSRGHPLQNPLLPPPSGREDWIRGCRRKSPHRREAQPCRGWHSWETALQFPSPWLYTHKNVLTVTWDSPLVGRQAMCQHLPDCQEGTGYPRWWPKEVLLRIRRFSPPRQYYW